MKEFLPEILIFLVTIALIIILYRDSWNNYKHYNDYKQKLGYNVLTKYKNKKRALEILHETVEDLLGLIEHLKKKYLVEDADPYKKQIVMDIAEKFNPEEIYEVDPLNPEKDTSYVINKGERMHLCLRRRSDPDTVVKSPILSFVLLHEVSHIGCRQRGHPNTFWSIFQFILKEAVEFGIYTPVDYKAKPVKYCGLSINYQPLNDKTLEQI